MRAMQWESLRGRFAIGGPFIFAVLLMVPAPLGAQQAGRWESAIEKFEQEDAKSPPAPGQILFLGSSSIRMWDVQKWFPDLDVFNRGFGGSQIADSQALMDRIVVPYQPRTIVFYAGDNDVAARKTPSRVAGDFRKFARRVHEELPETRILFISIKPSISRWKLVSDMRGVNKLVRSFCSKDERRVFIDIDTPMINENRTPREDLFLDDGLHLNEKGYELWTSVVRPYLRPRPDSGG